MQAPEFIHGVADEFSSPSCVSTSVRKLAARGSLCSSGLPSRHLLHETLLTTLFGVLCHKYSYCRDVCDGTSVLTFLRRIVPALSLKVGHHVPPERGQCPSRSPSQRTMPLEKRENTRRKATPSLVHVFSE